MFLTIHKLRARTDEIANYRYRDVFSLGTLDKKEDLSGEVNPALPTEFNEEISVGNSGQDATNIYGYIRT